MSSGCSPRPQDHNTPRIMNLQEMYKSASLPSAPRQDNGNAKRLRVDAGAPCFDEILRRLHEARVAARSRSLSNIEKVEIEVRLGMIIQDNYRRWKSKVISKNALTVDDVARSERIQFKAGVDPIFANSARSKLSGNDIVATATKLQILRVGNTGLRWEVNSRGQVQMSEHKESFLRSDIAMLAYDYDIRINAAMEENVALNPSADYSQWTQERRKRRTTYHHQRMRAWKIDFTEVDVVNRDARGFIRQSREIEVEFELNSQERSQWLLEESEDRAVEATRRLAKELLALIDYLVSFETATSEEKSIEPLASAEVERGISMLHMDLGRKATEFLGSMPVNLSRQNLSTVSSTNYFLTEKSDGIRYLMYIVRDAGQKVAVLVNRSRKVFKFRGYQAIGRFLKEGSILDGELVYSKVFRQNVFLVFDVLMWDRVPKVSLPFSDRLNFLNNVVMAEYAANYVEERDMINLLSKKFFDKSELSVLLGRIQFEEGERCYNDGGRRHHKSDGIIFQPDGEYVYSKHYDLLKWKWAELRSVDLRVSVERAEDGRPVVHLLCGGEDGTYINCTKRGSENIGLGVYDTLRLLADMDWRDDAPVGRAGSSAGPIVEVSYDVRVGMWSYKLLRRDKNEPNYITSVMGVFMEQAEAIGVEELEVILTTAAWGIENDYDRLLQDAKRRLLTDLQKRRPA